MEINFFNIMREYLDKGYTPIPVNGKAPIISSWQEITVTHEAIDRWEETLHNITGFGLRLGNGFGCIDYDTDDPELIKRIADFLDIPDLCVKKGMKGKTVFFTYTGKPNKQVFSHKISGSKSPVVEVFFGAKQTVMPPSLHPELGSAYQWITPELLTYDLEDLPSITEEMAEALYHVINSASLKEAFNNIPKSIGSETSGRWSSITRIAGNHIKVGSPDSVVIEDLVKFDLENHKGNEYFLDSVKLGFKSSDDIRHNAIRWFATFKANILKKDPKALETAYQSHISNIRIVDTGKATFTMDPIDFTKNKKGRYSEFPEDLIPTGYTKYVKDACEMSNMPYGSIVLPLLVSSAFTMQTTHMIKPKWDFHTFPNLFGMIVAPSGSRKDNSFDRGIGPLRDVLDEIRSKNPNTLLSDIKDIEETINDIDKKKKLAIKERPENLEEHLKEMNQEIAQLKYKLGELNQQKMDVIFEGGSFEMLLKIANNAQSTGIFLNQTEFAQLLAVFKKGGMEGYRQFLLKVANGTDRGYSHRTISGLNVDIQKVIGSMFCGVQTDVLHTEFEKVRTGVGDNNDGLFQRFLYTFPDIDIRPMSLEIDHLDDSIVKNNLYKYMNSREQINVKMDQKVLDYYIDHDVAVRQKGEISPGYIRSLKNKYSSMILKLALLYESQEKQNLNRIVREITLESMIKADRFLTIQSTDIDIFASGMYLKESIAGAESLVAYFRQCGVHDYSIKDLKKESSIKSNTAFNRAMELLEDHHWIRRYSNERIAVNPRF